MRAAVIVGEVFGRLTVLSASVSGKRNVTRVLVKCECGKIITLAYTTLRLKKKAVRSCGCVQKEKARLLGLKNAKSLGFSALTIIFTHYIKSAKNRDFCFELTREQFKDITSKDCHYCGAKPSNSVAKIKKNKSMNGDYIFNGIDRKDNAAGYTIENSLPCCKICNYAKRTLSYDEFIAYLNRVHNFIKTKV